MMTQNSSCGWWGGGGRVFSAHTGSRMLSAATSDTRELDNTGPEPFPGLRPHASVGNGKNYHASSLLDSAWRLASVRSELDVWF